MGREGLKERSNVVSPPAQPEVRVVNRVIFISRPVTIRDVLPFVFVAVVYAIVSQAIFSIWKKFHEKSFNIFLLGLIVAFPPTLMYIVEDHIFLYSWIIFDVYLLYLAKVAFGFNTDKDAPKTVYRSFKRIFAVTNHATVVLQLLTLLFFFLGSNYMLVSLRGMVYSIYFAVLSREVVKNLSMLMAQATGYYSKEGIPGRTDTSSRCMVCTGELSGKTVTLGCGHTYHKDCIMGYCIIGNNNHCQFCKHGVDNKIFEQDYWIKSELFIRPLMNTMRSCISFFIVMMGCYAWKQSRDSDIK